MSNTAILIVILAGVGLGVIGMFIVSVLAIRCDATDQHQNRLVKRLSDLEAESLEQQRLIDRLEAEADRRQPKRHTHATAAGLEDAIAVSIDLIREYKVTQEYTAQRIRQLQDILKTVRSGPLAYDEDRPTKSPGRRPVRDD